MEKGEVMLNQLWSAVRCDASDEDDPVEIRCLSCDLSVKIQVGGREISACSAIRDVLHKASFAYKQVRLQKKYEERAARRNTKIKQRMDRTIKEARQYEI
jgi:hypothetical protein